MIHDPLWSDYGYLNLAVQETRSGCWFLKDQVFKVPIPVLFHLLDCLRSKSASPMLEINLLGQVGCQYLARTPSLSDIVLNAVALAFAT